MRYFASSFLCLLVAGSLIAEDEFSSAVRIEAGDKPIDVGGFRGAAPFFGDFDGDGLHDLLVGQDDLGRCRIYRNIGTNKEPRFDNFEWFRVNGEIAELPGHGLFRPQLVDLNGDGKIDIVTASESGMIFWYRRDSNGEFADAEILKLENGEVLVIGTNAGCYVVDWDEDGDNDLIVSGRPTPDAPAAELRLVENVGSPQSLSLAPPKPLELDGQSIQAPRSEVYPFVADWNGDGKNDLLLGVRDGSVLLYENVGERHAPKLAKGRQLVEPPQPGRQQPINDVPNRGMGGSICVTDWDNDGKLDILIGDAQQETVQPELPDAAKQLEEAQQDAAQVLSDYRRLRRLNERLISETQEKQREFIRQTREKHAVRLEELREKISKLETAIRPHRESHGYVWLLRTINPPRLR